VWLPAPQPASPSQTRHPGPSEPRKTAGDRGPADEHPTAVQRNAKLIESARVPRSAASILVLAPNDPLRFFVCCLLAMLAGIRPKRAPVHSPRTTRRPPDINDVNCLPSQSVLDAIDYCLGARRSIPFRTRISIVSMSANPSRSRSASGSWKTRSKAWRRTHRAVVTVEKADACHHERNHYVTRDPST
jgi:hypothetical protein